MAPRQSQYRHRFFTFHYVSILIKAEDEKGKGLYIFTFHYVSILIRIDTKCCNPPSALYIPLCLYFNSMEDYYRLCEENFTFHYVSILIKFFSVFMFKLLCFTFHYVSILIPYGFPYFFVSSFLYIPLCLYFNPAVLCSLP